MTNVKRLHGVKYNLSTFTLLELDNAAAHTRRGLDEHLGFLAALDDERRARTKLAFGAEPSRHG